MLRQNVYDILVHSLLYVHPDTNISVKSQRKKRKNLSVLGNYTHTHTQTSKRNSKK